MSKIPVVAIFDVGKTNKKLFLFDQDYKIVFEKSARFIETVDEDGDVCENLQSLRLSVFDSLREVFKLQEYEIKAINFSTYGASLVYIGEDGNPVAPLYNYLKEYPEELKTKFYKEYGGEEQFSKTTASPVLGSLNSGMQIYRIKHQKPELYKQIKYILHLPQYLNYLITGEVYTDITSLGCHTNLWDFSKNDYHSWVKKEGILPKLAPIVPSESVVPAVFPGTNYGVGVGLHDSSAALIPYLSNFHEPFALISTGTWCITLNPFNDSPLTDSELKHDCLCYMQYKNKPVKASRVFAGFEHEQQVKRIAAHFNKNTVTYRNMRFDAELGYKMFNERAKNSIMGGKNNIEESAFTHRDLSSFTTDVEAYHQLMFDLATLQYESSMMVLKDTEVKRIFVDGGFSKNLVYMNLLTFFFPDFEIFAASMAQATAVGTALAIHSHWNKKPLPNDIIELKYYSVTHKTAL